MPEEEAGRIQKGRRSMTTDIPEELARSHELASHAGTVFRVVNGYAASQALFNADELNIFNLVHDGNCGIATLAESTGIAPGSLERILIACCVVGLLQREGNSFQLTDASRICLLKGEPGYVGGLFPLHRRGLYPVFQHLDSALRERRPQWSKVPGIHHSGPYEAMCRDEQALRDLHAFMFQQSHSTALAAAE
jgi:hypothetical protein